MTLDEESKRDARREYWQQWVKDLFWTLAYVAAFTILFLWAGYESDILLELIHRK
jgi:hypothetical protein